MGSIASITRDAGRAMNVFASESVASTAMSTVATGTTKPSHSNPCARIPTVYIRAHGIDHADHFVARNAGVA